VDRRLVTGDNADILCRVRLLCTCTCIHLCLFCASIKRNVVMRDRHVLYARAGRRDEAHAAAHLRHRVGIAWRT